MIQKNYPYLLVRHCSEGNASICISIPIVKEYIEVLARPKFSRFPDFKANADFLMARLIEMAKMYDPKTKVERMKDIPDNRFLDVAQLSKANFIVTGNTNDFTMKMHRTTRIVTPKEYWEECR